MVELQCTTIKKVALLKRSLTFFRNTWYKELTDSIIVIVKSATVQNRIYRADKVLLISFSHNENLPLFDVII